MNVAQNFFSPLRGTNSCIIISCHIFAAQYPARLQGTAKAQAVDLLSLNTLGGMITASLIPLGYDEHPCLSYMRVSPPPPSPGPFFDQHFALTSPSSPTTTRIGSVRISRQSISTFFLNVALNSNATDKIGTRPFMPALQLNLGR